MSDTQSLPGTAQDTSMRFRSVDDSSTMRRIIINTLHALGHEDVSEAGNGREGLERLREAASVLAR
jgi:CheY-like chemotaxis protein